MAVAHTLAPVLLSITAGTAVAQVAASSLGVRVTAWSIQNQSTASCYIGGSAVTTSTGFLIAAGGTLTFDRERIGPSMQTFALGNYYVITAATGAAMIAMYNIITDRG